jgi:hypothetical protein
LLHETTDPVVALATMGTINVERRIASASKGRFI